jgi:serine/threonine protein kinase
MTIPSGTAIGSIVVIEKISSGAAGDLYLARQPGLERSVALRKLRRDLLVSPGIMERFQREARLGAQALHPNVVQVFDLFAHRGDHYLVTEHVDGADLRAVLERAGRVPPRIATRIALEMVRGLEALHRRGILHCDLRPENVLLSRWGEVKLTGLATARQLGEAEPPSPPEPTPYSAPELRQDKSIDPQVDVFSLGAVLYELLTGRAPAEGRRLLLGVGPRLTRLIQRSLSQEPSRRPELAAIRRTLERSLARTAADSRIAIATWFWDVRLLRTKTPELPEPEPPPPHPTRAPTLRMPRLTLPAAAAAGLVILALLIRLGGSSDEQAEPTEIESLPPVSAVRPSTPEPAPPVLGPPAEVAFVAHPWAEIQVDELPPFLTPRAEPLELAPGQHVLVFRHPRYGEVRRSLEVKPGERRVVRHMFQRPAAR